MKVLNLIVVVTICLLFSGCADIYGCDKRFFSDKVSTSMYSNIIEEWYIDPNNPNSVMLGGSTADYGASAEKKKHNYIIKYSADNCEPISKNDLFKTNAIDQVDRYWGARRESERLGRYVSEEEYLNLIGYEKRYLYTKDQNGNYKLYRETFEDVYAIKQCFNDGYCQLYANRDGNIYYILKKFLIPID